MDPRGSRVTAYKLKAHISCMCVYKYICIYVHTYTYTRREREREQQTREALRSRPAQDPTAESGSRDPRSRDVRRPRRSCFLCVRGRLLAVRFLERRRAPDGQWRRPSGTLCLLLIWLILFEILTCLSWSRCLACSWTTEVEAGKFASDRDAVTNLLRNALG